MFATIHYNKRSAVDSRKSWRVCLFEENYCSPAVLNVPIYFTEHVAIIFAWKVQIIYRDPILSWWTSIAKEPSFSQKNWNTVLSLSVNETKLTLRSAFVLDLFALGGEKKSKYNEETPFWDSTCQLNLSLWKTHICVFLDFFSFRHFLASSSYF